MLNLGVNKFRMAKKPHTVTEKIRSNQKGNGK